MKFKNNLMTVRECSNKESMLSLGDSEDKLMNKIPWTTLPKEISLKTLRENNCRRTRQQKTPNLRI
jgi:hypothetical protein